jgi:alpha-tubulin suppressor-like RCC1 family protein
LNDENAHLSEVALKCIAHLTALVSVLLIGCETADAPTAPPDVERQAGVFALTGFELTSLSVGQFHTCGATRDGQAFCWGLNHLGQLGIGGTGGEVDVPLPVVGGLTFTSVDAGYSHTCGVTKGGQAFCWGNNANGRLGNGSIADSDDPVPVSGGLQFNSVSAGDLHTCGMTKGGQAFCWGDNLVGQLGNPPLSNSNVPVPVVGGLTFTSVSAGDFHTCGVTKGGQAFCWGFNPFGQLGNGSTSEVSHVPVPVSSALIFTSVSAAEVHTCGVTKGGQAFCWGSNAGGQLGNGSPEGSSVPVPVSGGLTFTSVDVGRLTSCGVTKGGQAYCWGHNFFGQLGNGSTTNSNVPVQVTGGFTFTFVNTAAHSCGLTKALGTWCWGYNLHGQLGNGRAPVNTNGPSPVVTSE